MGNSLSHPFNKIVFQAPKRAPVQASGINTHTTIVPSKSGDVPVVHYERKAHPVESRLCIIFSHGNAADLNHVGLYEALHKFSEIDVIAYDYTGYGYTQIDPSASPSQEACHHNLCAVNEYALKHGYHPENIILLGQSLGTGVTLHYASQFPGTYGRLILMAPMKSMAAVVADVMPSFLDLFPNRRYIKEIDVPVFIIHGTADKLIPWYHGKQLHQDHTKNMIDLGLGHRVYPPYWMVGAGHNDLFFQEGAESIFARIVEFCTF